MGLAQHAKLIGHKVLYPVKGMTFVVHVLDVRTAYNRTDVLISPVRGAGEQWVSLDSITVPEGDV